jgi:hypothetical protein
MDTQPQPQNPGMTPERPQQPLVPEGMAPARGPEQAPRSEQAPAPGGGPNGPAAATPQAKLSPADVAAALAAVPGPAAPGGVVPTPTAAGDVDVIEPEWVDKAEEVIEMHQGDPYGEEEAVEDLQKDYLLKRYGHQVGDPDSGTGPGGA